MKDTISIGFISGTIAGLAMLVIDFIGSALGIDKQNLLDWSAVIFYGRLPITLWEKVFAQFGQLFFAAILGVIFSFVSLKLRSQDHPLIGWLFGLIVWFSIFAFAVVFKISGLMTHTLGTSASHFLAASVYGVVLAEVFHKLSSDKIFG